MVILVRVRFHSKLYALRKSRFFMLKYDSIKLGIKIVGRVIEHNVLAFLTIVSIIVLASLFFQRFFHNIITRSNSEYRFSIVTIGKYYHEGDVRGKYILYSLNGSLYKDHCRGKRCVNTTEGERYLVKVFLSDPEIFEILFDKRVKSNLSVPLAGWEVIPNDCCVSR